MCNSTPDPYIWRLNEEDRCWMARGDFLCGQVTTDGDDDERSEDESRPLREKNRRNARCLHVPHRDKPPQVVAKRNARERRRVQAVNSAFVKLKKAVPFENHRGKRVSKVKTLQNAIEYIRNLQELLRKDGCYEPYNVIRNYYYNPQNDCFSPTDFEEDFQRNVYY